MLVVRQLGLGQDEEAHFKVGGCTEEGVQDSRVEKPTRKPLRGEVLLEMEDVGEEQINQGANDRSGRVNL
ncbi:hypothetical protein EK904_000177 [Melospiza melodia maxima]|nr:hypothetical protein EK904_000177 [Melospiza melodia maxima]